MDNRPRVDVPKCFYVPPSNTSGAKNDNLMENGIDDVENGLSDMAGKLLEVKRSQES